MTNLLNSSFFELLPPNLKDVEAKCLSAALDQQTRDLVAYGIQRLQIYGNIMKIDDKMADHLALTFDILSYKTTLPLEKKRLLVKNALLNYSRLGTKAAVEDAATIVHSETKIKEWFEYGAAPYFFRIRTDTSGIPINQNQLEELVETVLDYKNLRSWLDEIRIVSASNARLYTGTTAYQVGFLKANPQPVTALTAKMGLCFIPVPIIHMKYQVEIREEGATCPTRNT